MSILAHLRRLLVALGLSLAGFMVTGTATAQTNQAALNGDRPDAMMIMDFSGSMWGQVNGRPKFQIANDIIQRRFDGWNESLNLGVLAYGHRRKGDCRDVELAFEPGEAAPGSIRRWLERQSPVGKTPLGDSLYQAASYFKNKGQEANLIILSDGIESCGQDPCRIIQDLQADGAKLTAHVIGFALNETDSNALRCIADLTGGTYVGADRADQLDEGFRKAVEALSARDTAAEDALRDALNDSLAALRDAADRLDEANRRADQNAALLDDAQREIRRLEDLLNDKDATIAELAAALRDCDEEKARLEAALARAGELLADQASQIEDLESELRESRGENERLTEELRKALMDNDRLANDLRDSEAENGRLSDELRDALNENDRLNDELSASQAENERLAQALRDSEAENGRLSDELRDALNALDRTNADLDAANAENDALRDQVANLEDQLLARDQMIARLTDDIADMEAELARVNALLEEALRNRQITVSSLDFGAFEGTREPVDLAALVAERDAYLSALQELRSNLSFVLDPLSQAQAIANSVPNEIDQVPVPEELNEVKILLAAAVEGELPDLQWNLRGTRGDASGRRDVGTGARIPLPADEGTFEIALRLPGLETTLTVESDPTRPMSRDIALDVGRLMLSLPGSQTGLFFTTVKDDSGQDVARTAIETAGALYLRPGLYTVETRLDGEEDNFEVQIYAGKETAVPLRF